MNKIGTQVKKFVRDNTIDNAIIFEVGSHFGEDTFEFLQLFSKARVYGFEPDSRNIKVIKKVINNKRFQLIPAAVSDKDLDSVKFYQGYEPKINKKMFAKYSWIKKEYYVNNNLNASGASSLKKGHFLVKDAKVEFVPTIRLDTFCLKNFISFVDFLWIDVQGNERAVIESFSSMRNSVGVVWVEYGELDYEGALTRKQTITLLNEKGFELNNKFSSAGLKGNLLFINKDFNEKCSKS